ncbi:MAG: YcaO-like family protein, partial [Mycobacteriaceae bacterium]|nr:YcaO-like family protein [Mycobacteriaceae bacterium]
MRDWLQSSSLQHGEREFRLDDAERRVCSTIAELGLSATLQCYGGDPTVWRCQLVGQTGESTPYGMGWGKGCSDGARVGALYEALEHHVTQRPSDQMVLRSCAEVAASGLSGETYVALLAEQPSKVIACRVYQQLAGQDTLAVPLFLSNTDWVEQHSAAVRSRLGDTTDYTSLARYSSNSGCAIGGSRNEAAVHAINEAIERDALSLFLLRCIVSPTPSAPAFLDPATLPVELQTLLGQVQTRMGRDVWLIDITSDVGVPSTMAYSPGQPGHRLYGSGTSLSRHYSVHRALTELLQLKLGRGEVVAAEEVEAIELLREFPVLHTCAQLDLRSAAASAPQLAYVDTQAPSSPAGHLDELRARLAHRGLKAYYQEAYLSANGITAVH